jgi:hypothetical protein
MYSNETIQDVDFTEITEREKKIFDKFVDYYLEDFNEFNACIKIGYQVPYAKDFCKKLLNTSYIQKEIARKQRTCNLSVEAREQTDKMLAMSILRQLMQQGPTMSRVTAARLLSDIYGWTRNTTVTANDAMVAALKDFSQRAPV